MASRPGGSAPHAAIAVDVEQLIAAPKAALVGVLSKLKGWQEAREDTITVEQFSGAMTNLVYRCGLTLGGREVAVALMRVHASSSALFDRASEISTFKAVGRAGIGPRLLLLFDNGRVEEFLTRHVTLVAADLHDPGVSDAIAATMAHFHVRMSEALADNPHHAQGATQLWGRLRDWHRLAALALGEQGLAALGMDGLGDEIVQLEALLSSAHPCWVGLCHNDLQYGNIMALAATAPPPEPPAGGDALAARLAALGLAVGGAPASAPVPVTAAALREHDATLARLASDVAPFIAGASPAHSVASLRSTSSSQLRLRGRSPGRSVTLPDGSLVLPGMRARPRGQSPDGRGRKPAGGAPAGTGADAAAAPALAPAPSAFFDPPAAARGNGAGAGAGEVPRGARRAARVSHSGLDTSESAADSEDGDDLLLASLDAPGSGRRSVRAAAREPEGPSEVAADADAAARRSARYYRQLRRQRLRPAAGIEFPSFRGSDDDASGSDSDYGTSSGLDDDACSVGSGAPRDAAPPGPPPLLSGAAGSLTAAGTPAAAAAVGAAAAAGAGPGAAAGAASGAAASGGAAWRALTLIDYEYSGFNPVAFDIANHWCEWAADYHTDQPHVLDFARLPSPEQQTAFVEQYLAALLGELGIAVPAAAGGAAAAAGAEAAGGARAGTGAAAADEQWSTVSSRGGSVLSMPETEASYLGSEVASSAALSTRSSVSGVSERGAAARAGAGGGAGAQCSYELRSVWHWLDLHAPDRAALAAARTLDAACWGRLVASLLAASRAYLAASHLLWALWGVIQAQQADIDFDFAGYAQQRWQQYLITRPPALSSGRAAAPPRP
ncbi:choline kinase 3 [Scenedesmus sp. PABB004]|nr:choline kinase 3 [Scenedesmus sp. PABB004]